MQEVVKKESGIEKIFLSITKKKKKHILINTFELNKFPDILW